MKLFTRIAVVSFILVPSLVQASTILQFNQITFNDPFIVSPGSIIASDMPVQVTFDPSFCLSVGCGGLTNGTYNLNLVANATSAPVLTAGVLTQNFAGTISFTHPISLMNLLSVNFSDELSGSFLGSSPTLNSSQPPDIFSGSSDVFNPLLLGIPRGFALSFSDWSPAYGTPFATADATGTFSVTPVPEPNSLILLLSGMIFGFAIFRLMKIGFRHFHKE